MSTSATPNGAEPIGTLSASGSFTGKVRHVKIASGYAANIFTGDFVKMVSGGTCERSAITTTVPTGTVGVFQGCSYTDATTKQLTFSAIWPTGMVASDAVAYVLDDPFLTFKMQGDGSLTAAKIGLNCSGINTTGDTSIGRSKNALDASSAAATNTLPFRILELVDGPDSAAGDAYTDAIVTWLPGKHAYLTILGV